MQAIERKMIPCLSALGLCLVCGFFIFALPPKTFSEKENRTLQTDTGLTSYSVLVNKHQQKLELFLQDQFIASSTLKASYHRLQSATGISTIDGVYLLPDRLLPAYKSPLPDIAQSNTTAINAFVEDVAKNAPNVAFYFGLLPTATGVYRELVPQNLGEIQQIATINSIYQPANVEENTSTSIKPDYGHSKGVIPVDLHTILLGNKQKKLYYNTDSNLTSLGAYFTYSALLNNMGEKPISRDLFHIEYAKRAYQGDLYQKTLLSRGDSDTIELYYYAKGNLIKQVSRFNGANQTSYPSIYFREFLDKEQQANVFLGENCGVTLIQSDQSQQQRLLLFGDSSIKPILPFIALHFSEVTFVNLRYFTKQQIDLIVPTEYKSVVFLHQLPKYLQDNFIATKLAWMLPSLTDRSLSGD